MPDDAYFAFKYHGSSNAGFPDPLVSPWRFRNGAMELVHVNEKHTLCPGSTLTVRFSYGNKGRISISSSEPAKAAIYFSANPIISIYDRAAYTGIIFWGSSGTFGTTQRTVTVPNLSAGTYHVGVVVDMDDEFGEDEEYNNSTPLGVQVTIPSGC